MMQRRPAARLVRRVLAAIPLVVAAVLLGPAGPAGAHAYLTASNPADGASLPAAPRTLRLHFSESVDLPATRLDVVDGAGRHYAVTALRIERGEDTEEPSSIIADLPALPHGVYRVSWQTLSSDDLHRTSGDFAFGIDHAVARAAFSEPLPNGEEVALRWLTFLCIATVCGGLLGSRLLRRADADSTAAGAALRIGIAGALLGLAASAALLADQVSRSGQSVSRLMAGPYGTRWTVRECGLLLVLVASVLALRGRRRAVPGFAAAGAAGVGVGSALLGHAAATPGATSTRVAADALHLLASATWIGTLLVMCVAGVRAGVPLRAALRRFAVPAAVGVSIVVATGVYLSSGVVGSVDAALYTWYGRALLAKVALFGVVGALGLVNHRRLRGARPGRGRWTLTAEAVVGTLVLGLAAFLTSGQPAREPEFVAAPQAAPVAFADGRVADLQQSVRLSPNRPGRNVVVLDVLDTRRPTPGPVQRVLVRMLDAQGSASSAVAAEPLAILGRWSAAVTVTFPGSAGVEVTVQRAGLPPVRHVFDLVVAGSTSGTRQARLSTAPIESGLRTAGLLLAAALALGWLLAGAARRRRRPDRATTPAAAGEGRPPTTSTDDVRELLPL